MKAFIWIGIALILAGCGSLPPETKQASLRIATGPGPEDMALDNFGPRPRILVSSMDRRNEDPNAHGEIWFHNLDNGTSGILHRIEEPRNLVFRPHGISLQQTETRLMLYVISHDPDPRKHYVHTYQVLDDQLIYDRTFTDSLFRSPNDLYALPTGAFFLSNDSYSGTQKELMLGQKKCEVVRVDYDGNATVVAENIGMGNGVLEENGWLYVAATRENKVLRYALDPDETQPPQSEIDCPGPDNLTLMDRGLLTVGHAKPLAFIRHAKKASKRSPTIVYRLDLEAGTATPIFVDKGSRISAGSTALIYKDKLYISQVFEPWLLEVELAP